MPALVLPAALAALAALLLPLAIHLARRSEAAPLDFAALRWLRPKPRPRSRLRFDEWPLLIVRLLLLTLVALWLARPMLPDSADRTPVLAALPGVDTGTPPPGTRNVWLAPGFPPLGEPQPSCLALAPARGRANAPILRGPGAGKHPLPCPNLLSLIRQLDSELAPGIALTLVVPEILQGVDAERPRLSRPVTWKIAPGAMLATTPEPTRSPLFSLRGPTSAARPLRAAIAALSERPTFDTGPATAPLPKAPRVLVWLTPGPLPGPVRAWITAGGTALVTSAAPAEPGVAIIPWRDAEGLPVVAAHSTGAGRLFRFTRPLTPATMPGLLEPDFPHRLAALFTVGAPPPSRVFARDIAPITGAPAWPQPARDLQPLLAIILAGMFVAERWLATHRSRAIAP